MRDLANQELGLVAVGPLVIRGGDGRSADRHQGGAMLNAGPGAGRRSGRWTKIASALVPAVATLLFGTVLFVTVFGPKGGPTGARSASTRPPLVKVVSSEKRPTDVDPSSALISTLAPSEPAPTSVEPAATAQVATLRPAVSQSTESNPLRMASAPPDAPAPSATLASEAAPLDAPQRPAEAAPRVEGKVVVGAQPRTPNLHRIAKLSRRLYGRQDRRDRAQCSGRDAAPTPAFWCVDDPAGPNRATHGCGACRRPETRQSNDTCLRWSDWRARAIGGRSDRHQIGRLGDSVRRAKIGGRGRGGRRAAQRQIRPGAKRREIGVRKTQVNGETIYALRVAGLSKADAIALCVRVKGRDCSIIK